MTLYKLSNLYLKKNLRYIHNHSYVLLNNKYNDIKNKNKEYQLLITNLNNKINTLEKNLSNLNNKNKLLEEELLEKTRFYNLNIYKFK
jgi:hypothetical protein